MEEERLLTVASVAETLHLSKSKVWLLVARGDLPSLTIGRSRRVAASALAQFIKERGEESRTATSSEAVADVLTHRSPLDD